MYKTERFSANISVKEYMEKYTDVDKFVGYCKKCPNYGRKWSCPEYDFDVKEYLGKYKKLNIIGLKIIFDPEFVGQNAREKTVSRMIKDARSIERDKLDREMLKLERAENGCALYAGSCTVCGSVPCKRVVGEPCRNPNEMRYSLESLGGDVSKICSELLGMELVWSKDGKVPEYTTLVCGVLS